MTPEQLSRLEDAIAIYHDLHMRLNLLISALAWLHDPRVDSDCLVIAHECLYAGQWVENAPKEEQPMWVSRKVSGVN